VVKKKFPFNKNLLSVKKKLLPSVATYGKKKFGKPLS